MTMTLKVKYQKAVAVAGLLKITVEEKGGKLRLVGKVPRADARRLLGALTAANVNWPEEVEADVQATDPNDPAPTTYTVQVGDTLSQIALDTLGDANAYMDIFNANTPPLTDPNVIQPGQVLTIPAPPAPPAPTN